MLSDLVTVYVSDWTELKQFCAKKEAELNASS